MPNLIKYFRNKIHFDYIETDSLWQLIEGNFVLVDSDEPVSMQESFYKDYFYEVSVAEEIKK